VNPITQLNLEPRLLVPYEYVRSCCVMSRTSNTEPAGITSTYEINVFLSSQTYISRLTRPLVPRRPLCSSTDESDAGKGRQPGWLTA
jgi:hypothetical protein